MTRPLPLLAAAALLSLSLSPSLSRAAAPDAAAAEASFASARALMKQGRYAEACPALEASLRLDPAVGTLLNLGECLERSGRNASAWLRFREAAAMALHTGQREREAIARDRVRALEPTLCHLVVRPSPSSPSDDALVTRDGEVLSPSALGLRIPVDPGVHVVVATTAGSAPRRVEITVAASADGGCADAVVDLPASPRASPARAAPAPHLDLGLTRPAPERASSSPHRTTGILLGGTGLAALGASAAFALLAADTKAGAASACTSAGCTELGRARLHDAGAYADVATGAFVLGTALLTGGIALWLFAPRSAPGTKSATR